MTADPTGRSAQIADSVQPFPWWAAVAGLFVAVAVVAEMVGGQLANSPVSAWAEDVAPIAWPQPARVAWWLAVAGAAAAFRLGERQAGIVRHPLVIVASVVPFLAFAVGIAIEADWATWH